MKVLVVDDDIDFRGLARVFLKRSFPRAAVAEYDPEVLGLPRDDFPWADYDVVLLDHELGAEQTGLDWLRLFARLPGFPAVIFTTAAGDENVAARAMKFGADEYLSKREVSAERLGELVGSVLAEREADAGGGPRAGAPPAAGARESLVPGYATRRLLGCGGSADVWLAQRESDGLTVVVKILREAMAGDQLAIRRLLDEAEMLESIDSAQVVRVHAHGVERGRAYLTMEYLGHGDLRLRIASGMDRAAALDVLRGIARGLRTVHAHGILHRDLKPANVMFRYDDSVALTDFGIALSTRHDPDLTTTGSLVGTPSYMSPEQCEGQRLDARSDLYSLGIMLHEMLTGVRPFLSDSPSMLFMQHTRTPLPRLPQHVEDLQPLVDRLAAKRPDERFDSAEAVLEEIERVAR